MASIEAEMLKEISRVKEVSDTALLELERISGRLESDVIRLTAEGAKSEAVEAAMTRVNIQTVLAESGYYEIGESVYNKKFQDILNGMVKVYDKSYGKVFSYTPLSLENLGQIKDAALTRFSSLGDDLAERLTMLSIDAQFGRLPKPQIRGIISEDVTGYMDRYVKTWVNTSLSDFQTKASQQLMEDNGIKKFKYIGVSDNIIRNFCKEHLGQVKTKEEWRQILNSEGQSAWTHRGGWNCRHRFVGVIE